MQVVILAGGFGTRLSEETENIPKPMVTIGDIPILLHLMRYYSSFGHTDFLIALGYKGYVIKEFFANFLLHDSDLRINLAKNDIQVLSNKSLEWNIDLIDTGLDSGTGGRLLRLKEYLAPEFLLTYGDGLSNVNLDMLIKHHKSMGKLATVTAVRPPARFGSLVVDNKIVRSFSEKNPQEEGWINGGFFYFSKSICDYIENFQSSLEGLPIERLVAEGQLSAFLHEDFWQPMDTLRDKRTLETIWSEGKAPWKR